MKKARLEKYREEVLAELKYDILEFWMKNVIDYDKGGFYGAVGGDGRPKPDAKKGVILASRILWTYSRAYIKFKDRQYLKTAELMYEYIIKHFVDKKYGGVYWMLNADGNIADPIKKFYGQAFAIYGFAEYAKASKRKQAMKNAMQLFSLMEKYGRDKTKGGYIDALAREWKPVKDTRLSTRDMNTPKTMNTNLHVMEAYSALALHTGSKKVIKALENLVNVFIDRIIMQNSHFGLFFDMDWKEASCKISFGHDIEGSWLLTEAAGIIGNKKFIDKVRPYSVRMAEAVMREAIDKDGGIYSEKEANGHIHRDKEWWMQVEAMVGFMNAYEITKKEIFLEKSLSAWEYCKKYYLRPGGEWYPNLDENNRPDKKRDIAGPWKCPYHAGRACMEIAERIVE